MDDLKASRLTEVIQDSGKMFQVVTVLGKNFDKVQQDAMVQIRLLLDKRIYSQVDHSMAL